MKKRKKSNLLLVVFLFGIILIGMIGVVLAEESSTNNSTNSCTDSDGGLNYYLKGIVSGSVPVNWASSEDLCTNDITLRETYCDDKDGNNDGYLATAQIYDCPNGCSDGVCICPTTKCNDGTVYGPEKCNVKNNVCECPSCPAIPETCKQEGGVIDWQDSLSQCCGGLAKIIESSAYSSDCSAMTTNANSICTNCGNTVCGTGENKCNCPQDCKTSTTPVCSPTKCSDGSVYECKIVDNKCLCPTCPVRAVDFYISGVEGIKKAYFPSETLNLIIKGVEQDGTPASSEEGFNIQFYIDEWPLVQGQSSKGDNAYYKEGYWYGSMSVPDKLTGYRLQIFLYCSRDNSYCSKKYGIKGAQVENTYYFSIISGGEKISEKVFCGFANSDKEQKCYTAEQNSRAYCSGVGNCAAEIKGYKGEKITWKSSCGDYKYTSMDGNDEKIEFDCKSGETKTEEIKNKGFKNVYFQCYDGAESKSTDREACKSSDYWKKFAANFCGSRCENNLEKCKQKYRTENKEDENVMKCLGKCGVNSFSIGAECYIEETLTTIPVATPVETIPSTPAEFETGTETTPLKEEPALICKDSCPLDGKCYPFGFRKIGKYCSDSGGFEEQLKSDSICDNNFECSSNVCVSGKCISGGFLKKIMNWFSRMFGG